MSTNQPQFRLPHGSRLQKPSEKSKSFRGPGLFRLAGVLVGTLSALSFTSTTSAAPGPCLVEGSTTEITLTVAQASQLPLFIICSGTAPASKILSIGITTFSSDAGSLDAVKLLLPPEFKTPSDSGPAPVAFAPVIPVRLQVPLPPSEAKYTGRIYIMSEGADPSVAKLTLTRGVPPGSLVLDHQQLTLQLTQPFWGSPPEESLSVAIRDKTQQHGLQNIRVGLQTVLKQPGRGFDLRKNVSFTVNNEEVKDLDQWPPADPNAKGELARSFGPGGQSEIGMHFQNLEPGEYNVTLGFSAANALTDDTQRLTLILQVKHSIWWSIALLIVAVTFSFVASKVLASMVHRYLFLSRIRKLRPPWLADEPASFPVVWVRAALRETEDLSQRFWLTGVDQVDARVNQIEALIGILGLVRAARQGLMQSKSLPRLPRVRAIAALNAIASGLTADPLTDAQLADLKTKLAAFSAWLDATKMSDCYWTVVREEITILLLRVSPAEIADDQQRPLLVDLAGKLRAALIDKPGDLDGMMKVERAFAVLKIFWNWRGTDDFAKFIDLVKTAPAEGTAPTARDIDEHLLEQIFELADRRTWELLAKANSENKLQILFSWSDTTEPAEAYDPLPFRITTNDPRIDNSYLFKHALTFNWKFKLVFRKSWLRSKGTTENAAESAGKTDGSMEIIELSPVTLEPRVVQYVPRGGQLKLTATLKNDRGDSLELASSLPPSIPVVPNSDFGIFRGLARVESISWALSAIVAVVTGLSMFYYKGPSFGTFQDYLTLFLWGAGVDQGKNFLQAMQTYSVSTVKKN
jgi:hypothetical protein